MVEIGIGGVERQGRRAGHGHRPAASVAHIVAHLVPAGGVRRLGPARERRGLPDRRNVERRVAVQSAGPDVHALRTGQREHVGLERGSNLLTVLQGHIELAVDLLAFGRRLGETRPAVQGPDGTGARLLEHRAYVRVTGQTLAVLRHQGLVLVHRGVQLTHHVPVDRGDDTQAAAVDLRLGVVVGVLQLVQHGLHDVATRPGPVGAYLGLHDLREFLRGGFLLRQGARAHHGIEHVVPAVHQGGVSRGARRGVVPVGRLDHGRQHGGLRHIELGRGNAEIRLAGRAEAIHVATQQDGVEVLGQNPVLGLLLGQLLRHEDFLDLAADRLGGPDVRVVVPDELLGDRRTALRNRTAGHVGDGGPDDADGRDPALVVEMLVLGRDHRVPDHGGNLVRGEQLPVRGAERAHDRLAVPVVDDRRLLEGGL